MPTLQSRSPSRGTPPGEFWFERRPADNDPLHAPEPSAATAAGQAGRPAGFRPERRASLLSRLKEILFMAIGRDDDDDYECNRR